jgi:hypothetical protein
MFTYKYRLLAALASTLPIPASHATTGLAPPDTASPSAPARDSNSAAA